MLLPSAGSWNKEDVNEILKKMVAEIDKALNLLAPLKTVRIKDRITPLHLHGDTRRIMAERDAATRRKDWDSYRRLRNLAVRKVSQDRLRSTMNVLTSSKGDPNKLWKLADALTGRSRIEGLS